MRGAPRANDQAASNFITARGERGSSRLGPARLGGGPLTCYPLSYRGAERAAAGGHGTRTAAVPPRQTGSVSRRAGRAAMRVLRRTLSLPRWNRRGACAIIIICMSRCRARPGPQRRGTVHARIFRRFHQLPDTKLKPRGKSRALFCRLKINI